MTPTLEAFLATILVSVLCALITVNAELRYNRRRGYKFIMMDQLMDDGTRLGWICGTITAGTVLIYGWLNLAINWKQGVVALMACIVLAFFSSFGFTGLIAKMLAETFRLRPQWKEAQQ